MHDRNFEGESRIHWSVWMLAQIFDAFVSKRHYVALGLGPMYCELELKGLPTCEAHAVEHSGVEHGGHGMRVQGLLAEGPHEGAGAQVQLCRHHRCPRLVALQHLLAAHFGG